MKSTEEYINEVYKKYAQTQEQNIKYKVVKMRPKRPLIPVCVIAACLVAVVSLGMGLKNYEKVENPERTDYVQIEENNKIYTKYLRTDARLNEKYLSRLINNSSDILIISDFEKDKVDFELSSEIILLKTIGSLKIDKILKNNTISQEYKEISYLKTGGIISFKELEKNHLFDSKIIDKDINIENMSETQKNNTYLEQKPNKGTDFEEGKQYLVFLNYNKETELYEIFDLAFGIMEYDPETNKVKNIDTGEFEEFDWDLIK